jgi:hypothetical protein
MARKHKNGQRNAGSDWLEAVKKETATRWIGQAPRGKRPYPSPRVNFLGQKPLYTIGEAMQWARKHKHAV